MKSYFFSALLCCCAFISPGKSNLSVNTVVNSLKGKGNLCFIENKGQISDQNGKSRKDIDFKINAGNGLNIFIGKGTLHYQWIKNSKQTVSEFIPANKNTPLRHADLSFKTDIYRMDVELEGANKNAELITEEKQLNYERYFNSSSVCGNDGTISNKEGILVQAYKKIIYKNIYPNIDWALYFKEGEKLEYDFIVHPGGNVADIQLKYNGDTSAINNKDGSITIATPFGSITENAPNCYVKESGIPVLSEFQLINNTLSFKTENYNGTLVIDPTLAWATYYGGSGDEGQQNQSIAYDFNGNIYITGYTTSTSNMATTGTFQSFFAGAGDAYLAKFNSSGSIQWATYYGGPNYTEGYGVSCDTSGNVYIIGNTSSASNIATIGAYQTVFGGGLEDVYLAKFNSSGALQWATYYGYTGVDYGWGVACDRNGNVFITGFTNSTTNMTTSGAYQPNYGGGVEDAFLVKFNSSGTIQWATYYGGLGEDRGCYISCDGGGNIYMTGFTFSTNGIATAGAHQTIFGGYSDGFLVKFSSSGVRQWATYYGGLYYDEAWVTACDRFGNVYLTGYTNSPNNISSPGAYQTTNGGSPDAFLAKFNSSGTRQWATYYGGIGSEEGHGLYCDSFGKVYLSGYANSTNNIASPGAYQTTFGGGNYDAFLAKFNSSGSRKWCTYYGGSSTDAGTGATCDGTGNIYLSGGSSSANNIATAGAYQTSWGGQSDAFIAKFNADTMIGMGTFYDTSLCAGDTFHIAYAVNKSFLNGNVFIAQLSDSSGAFGNPVNIGSITFSNADSIFCTIPLNVVTGLHYRIRIIASNPVDTSDVNDINIHIVNLPSPIVRSNSPACTGDSLKLYASDTLNGISWLWTGPGFSDTMHNTFRTPTVFTDSGNYIVKATFGNCHKSDTIHVGINPSPSVPVPASNSPVCSGDTLKLMATDSTAGINWQWSGPNFSSTLQNAFRSHVAGADSGNYVLTAILGTCSKSAITHVTVKLTPSIPILTSSNQVCMGDTLKLRATDSIAGVSWLWTGPNFSDTMQNTFRTPATLADSGNYVVKATLGICSRADTIHISVRLTPSVPLATSNSPVCTSDTLKLMATDTTSGISWQWTGPNFTDTMQNTFKTPIVIADSGTYTITAVLGNCKAKDSIHVNITPPVTPSVSLNPPTTNAGQLTTFSASGINGGSSPSYKWYLNGTIISGATSSSYSTTLAANDSICVLLFSNAPCAVPDSATACSHAILGVSKHVNASLSIYPNPVNNELKIEGAEAGTIVKIYNILGQEIYKSTINSNEKTINTEKFAKGTYILKMLFANGSSEIRKLVKK